MNNKVSYNHYRFYTSLVEHYFRMGVRHSCGNNEVSSRWIAITKHWLSLQPPTTKRIVNEVFSSKYQSTEEGLATVLCDMQKAERNALLNEIETDYAIFTGLIGGNQVYDRRTTTTQS